jgi:hypothetical protein
MTCPRCGRPLTAPASLKRGMGRTCKAHEIAARADAKQLRFDFTEDHMRGFIYRLGTWIKDHAERIKNPVARFFGIPAGLIRLGYAIRDAV